MRRMYNWSDEQIRAIETVGVPIIVSAAAGSGKTAVLVERTIRLLADREKNIPADTLLAVTFTNDAASQMSQKLSWEIDKRAEENPDDEWIQRQQSLLRLAEITTINSFCYGLVKENLSETDFHTGVRILEENEAAMLTDRALTAVLEREYSERSAETERLISLFCRENDASLRRMILNLYRFLRALPFRDIWAKRVISDLRSGKTAERISEEIKMQIKDAAASAEASVSHLRSCAEALEYHSAARRIFCQNCELAEKILEKLCSAGTDEVLSLISGISWMPLTGARQTKAEKECASELENALYESAKQCFTQLKEQISGISDICGISEKQVMEESYEVADAFEKLCLLCEKLDSEVMQMKVEKNAVDFADTELICVRLLVNCDENGTLTRTPLCDGLVKSGRYRMILIDEFQDVNNLQEVIFKAISDTGSLSEIGKNVFAVGDVKQSIYRFRQANPMIFMKTREQGKSEDSAVCELLLRKNFRSRGSVLDFCNYVFRSLMSKRLGETEYTDEEALVRGSDFMTPDSPTEIITYDGGGKNSSEQEFTAVARRIRQMIDSGEQVLGPDGFRPCKPSDFCVLTRNNVTGSELSEIFEREGLKVLASDTSGYLKSREISLLLNLLSVISNPMQDIPLASVMLSPILGFSDDDLAELKIMSRDSRLYKTVLEVSKGGFQADAKLKEKCAYAVGLIKRLSVLASGLTLTRLIRKIYDVTDIFAAASAYEDGDQKCANLYLLLEYAKAYEQASADGVTGFLRYIGYISESGGDFEQALTVTESSDSVTVKTVHRSKGLEYPFVFICQTGKHFNKTDLNGSMLLNSERGVGFSFYDYSTLTRRRTSLWRSVREANNSELLSEELRLLYVALTRAKERLFILLDISDKAVSNVRSCAYEITGSRVPPSVAQKASCTADWLMMALLKHPDLEVLRSKLGFGQYDGSADLPAIKVMPAPAASKAADEKISVIAQPDPKLTDALIGEFSRQPDHRLTRNEAKLTVSEIVKDDALSFFPRVPDLGESLEELSAAQRGTVTHRFMQFCDFKAASTDIGSEISRLTGAGIFTSKDADAIDRKSVAKFFAGDIYARLSRSGKVLREQQFIVKFDDIDAGESLESIYRGTDGMLQGIADCLFEEDDGYVLVDYKTDRVTSLSQLAGRYSAQLRLYKAAFDVLLDKPVKSCFIYSFRLGDGIEVSADSLRK